MFYEMLCIKKGHDKYERNVSLKFFFDRYVFRLGTNYGILLRAKMTWLDVTVFFTCNFPVDSSGYTSTNLEQNSDNR